MHAAYGDLLYVLRHIFVVDYEAHSREQMLELQRHRAVVVAGRVDSLCSEIHLILHAIRHRVVKRWRAGSRIVPAKPLVVLHLIVWSVGEEAYVVDLRIRTKLIPEPCR